MQVGCLKVPAASRAMRHADLQCCLPTGAPCAVFAGRGDSGRLPAPAGSPLSRRLTMLRFVPPGAPCARFRKNRRRRGRGCEGGRVCDRLGGDGAVAVCAHANARFSHLTPFPPPGLGFDYRPVRMGCQDGRRRPRAGPILSTHISPPKSCPSGRQQPRLPTFP